MAVASSVIDADDSLLSVDVEASLTQKRRDAREWLLLDGNRYAVALGVLALVFGSLGALELVGNVAAGRTDPLYYLLSSLVGGNITLITVVVSINQLLLSRELAPPGELQSEIENVVDYRSEVEDAADAVAPVEPLGFLRLLFQNTEREVRELRANAERYDSSARDSVGRLSESLLDHVGTVTDLLSSDGNTATFRVLSTTLTTNYARQIYLARRIRHEYAGSLAGPTRGGLERVIDRLQMIDVARQYFKSVYLQQELSALSRRLLYAGIPAEIATTAALLSLSEGAGATPLTRHMPLMILVVVTVGFVPLALLFAYIVRIATVTQRTAAITPFTTPEQEQ